MVNAVAKVLEDDGPLVRNASVAATEVIRQAILDGRLEPGRRLKEEELARELGISRTPVREALLILQAEGLVVGTPNRGAISSASAMLWRAIRSSSSAPSPNPTSASRT